MKHMKCFIEGWTISLKLCRYAIRELILVFHWFMGFETGSAGSSQSGILKHAAAAPTTTLYLIRTRHRSLPHTQPSLLVSSFLATTTHLILCMATLQHTKLERSWCIQVVVKAQSDSIRLFRRRSDDSSRSLFHCMRPYEETWTRWWRRCFFMCFYLFAKTESAIDLAWKRRRAAMSVELRLNISPFSCWLFGPFPFLWCCLSRDDPAIWCTWSDWTRWHSLCLVVTCILFVCSSRICIDFFFVLFI